VTQIFFQLLLVTGLWDSLIDRDLLAGRNRTPGCENVDCEISESESLVHSRMTDIKMACVAGQRQSHSSSDSV
jgi:hypothetical protein